MRASTYIEFPARISRRETIIGASAGFSAFVLSLDGSQQPKPDRVS